MDKRCKQIGIIDNNGFEKANRVYKAGSSPTIQARDFKDSIKVLRKWKRK